jgi:hypothetical protein
MILSAQDRARNEQRYRGFISTARARRDDTDGRRALGAMAGCPDAGAAILAELRNSRPTDRDFKGLLLSASRARNDRRIIEALMNVISDLQADRLLRLRAIEAMASQLEPRLFLLMGTMVDIPRTKMKGETGAVITIQSYRPGGEEPTKAFLAAIESELQLVAARDSVLGFGIRGIVRMAQQTRKQLGGGG